MMGRWLAPMREQERGAVLVLVMVVMLMLLGFAALGVDASAAYAEKRQAQSEADASVMAGALVYLDASSATSQAVAAQVIAFAAINAPGTPPTPTDWANCQDQSKPLDYSPLTDLNGDVISDCISLKQVANAPVLLRVKTPSWDMPTSFAGLIGFDTVTVSATATAEVRNSSSLPVLPFSLPSNPSLEECMATSPSGLLPDDTTPCEGSIQGNFGLIDSPWFGAPSPEFTDEDPCPRDPNFNTRAPHNLAYGLDHLVTSWPTKPSPPDFIPPPPIPDVGDSLVNHPAADTCANAQTDIVPYVLQTQPGDTQSPQGKALLMDGFLGDDPSPTSGDLRGRLRQPSSLGLIPTKRLNLVTNTKTLNVDNTGLWEYLKDDGVSPSNACHSSQFSGKQGRALTDQLLVCLDRMGSGTPIFDIEIIQSPRFAVVPVLNYLPTEKLGSKWWAVVEMRPVYLQSSWYDCTTGSNKECLFLPDDFAEAPFDATNRDHYSILFNPGESLNGPCYLNAGGACVPPNTSQFQLMGLSALVLTWDQVPGAEDQFGGNSPFEVFLHPNE
jgi:hypothetical protein